MIEQILGGLNPIIKTWISLKYQETIGNHNFTSSQQFGGDRYRKNYENISTILYIV